MIFARKKKKKKKNLQILKITLIFNSRKFAQNSKIAKFKKLTQFSMLVMILQQIEFRTNNDLYCKVPYLNVVNYIYMYFLLPYNIKY